MFYMIGRVTSNVSSFKNKSIKNIEINNLSNYKEKINKDYKDDKINEEELCNDNYDYTDDDRSTMNFDHAQVSSLKCMCEKSGI